MKKKDNFNFDRANEMISHAIKACSDLCIHSGLIRVDFADVRTVLSESGLAVMGIGSGSGDNRASQAATQAINCLDPSQLTCATGALVVIRSDESLSMQEFSQVGDIVRERINNEADVVVGTAIDPTLQDTREVRVTIILAGVQYNPLDSV